ncbi:unnamed protein product, partial [marine sediment metagenome]
GCLGILIPPSIMLIVYAATSNVSVVKLYAGAILPGFLLAGLYIVYVIGRSIINPSLAPKLRDEDVADVTRTRLLIMVVTSFFPLAFLILSVLGAILAGLATPSEAAAVGALGGLLLAIGYRVGNILQGDLVPDWVGEAEKRSDLWFQVLGVGALAVLAMHVAYIVAQAFMAFFGGGPVSLEGGLFGGPYINTALGLVIGLGSLLVAGRVPLIGSIWPTRPATCAMMTFAGHGAAGGVGAAGAYLVAVHFFGFDKVLRWHEPNNWAVDIG